MLLAVGPAAVLNVASNILLLPIYGMTAAGWSTVLGYAIALLLAIRFGRRYFVCHSQMMVLSEPLQPAFRSLHS
ncbi:MAG: polysaccharide biosynthesis C-terminal domain-containing protein [Bryobacteraceae bacterium]